MVAWSALSMKTALAKPHFLRFLSRKSTKLTTVSLGANGVPIFELL